MTGVTMQTISKDEAGLRLDRWFKRHFPDLAHSRLEKLLRTGQIRIDGARAKSGDRLEEGQAIRIPPLPEAGPRPAAEPQRVDPAARRFLEALIIHSDKDAFVLNKPAGLAVQGGTGTQRHLDGMLDALASGGDRPRLVHRLDRDTSGVLVLARSASAADKLAKLFRARDAEKIYWAVTAGVPKIASGTIDLALAKLPGRGPGGAHERVVAVEDDEEDGKRAITDYVVLAHAGKRAALVALRPRTGRTHQLRAHLAAIGTPILGDRKYGGAASRVDGLNARALHLHARAIRLPPLLSAAAPPPPHLAETCEFLGLDLPVKGDPFAPFRNL